MNRHVENQNHPELDGPLEAAVSAVLSRPVPGDAVERVKRRAHDSIRHSQPAYGPRDSRVRFPTILGVSLAASVLAIAVGGLALLGLSLGSTTVFAQVAERLESLRSMVCHVRFSETGTLDDSQNQLGTRTVTYLAPSLHRIDDNRQGTIQIVDREQNRTVLLISKTKQAIVVDGPAAAAIDANSPVRIVEALMRHIRVDRAGDDGIKSLGSRIRDGTRLQGYESTIGREIVRAWFDAETLVPATVAVRFEIPSHIADGNIVPMWQIMSDIEVDVDVSRKMFATSVPDGYETLSFESLQERSLATLDDVIEMLRLCAGENDGEFPLWLSSNKKTGTPLAIQSEFAASIEEQLHEGDETEKTAATRSLMEFGASLGRATEFQLSMKPENDWNYFGGAKLHQQDRPVLWYSPAGDDNYKVVYADLTVEDVTRDNLPQPPDPVVREPTPKGSIHVSTPRFTLPQGAVRSHVVLEQLREEGRQSEIENLNLAAMPELSESQFQLVSPEGEIVIREADPTWKPDRDPDSTRLEFLQEFPNLKGLDLSGLYLTQPDLDTIARCKKLQRLSVSGVRVFKSSSRGLVGDDLAKFSTLTSLEQLDLSQSNFIGGLKHLNKLPRLHTLYLSSFEHLNDASVSELGVLPNLETLVLAPVYWTNPETTVTEAGLKSLQDLPRLRTLYVGHHGERTLPIERLKELLPSVDVRSPTGGVPPTR